MALVCGRSLEERRKRRPQRIAKISVDTGQKHVTSYNFVARFGRPQNEENLLDALDSVTTKTETISYLRDDIQSMSTKIELKWLERKELMRQEFASLLETLTTQWQKLLADLDEEVSKSLEHLNQLQQDHDAVLSDTCQLSDECISAVQNLPQDQFINSYPLFMDSMKHLVSKVERMASAEDQMPAFLQMPFSLYKVKLHLHHRLQSTAFNMEGIKAREHHRFVPKDRLKEGLSLHMLLETPTNNQLPPSSTLHYNVNVFWGTSRGPLWSNKRPLKAEDIVINGNGGHKLLPGQLYVVKIQPVITCTSHMGDESVEGRSISIVIITDTAVERVAMCKPFLAVAKSHESLEKLNVVVSRLGPQVERASDCLEEEHAPLLPQQLGAAAASEKEAPAAEQQMEGETGEERLEKQGVKCRTELSSLREEAAFQQATSDHLREQRLEEDGARQGLKEDRQGLKEDWARQGLKEDVARQGLKENGAGQGLKEDRQGLKEDWARQGLKEDGARLGLKEDSQELKEDGVGQGLREDWARLGLKEDWTGQGLKEDWVGQGLKEDGAKQGLKEDGARQGLKEDGARQGLKEDGARQGLKKGGAYQELVGIEVGGARKKLPLQLSCLEQAKHDLRELEECMPKKLQEDRRELKEDGARQGLKEAGAKQEWWEDGARLEWWEDGARLEWWEDRTSQGLMEDGARQGLMEDEARQGLMEDEARQGLMEDEARQGLKEARAYQELVGIEEGGAREKLPLQLSCHEQAKHDLRELEEHMSKKLQALHQLRVLFVQDLQNRFQRPTKKAEDEDEQPCDNVAQKQITFLEHKLEELTNLHKQLMKRNAHLRCEVAKLQARLAVNNDQVKRLEAALKQAKESDQQNCESHQRELDRIKEMLRQKGLVHIGQALGYETVSDEEDTLNDRLEWLDSL